MSDRLKVLQQEKQRLLEKQGAFHQEEIKVFSAIGISVLLAFAGMLCEALVPKLLPSWITITMLGIGALGLFIFGLWGASLFKGQERVQRNTDLIESKIEEHQSHGA